MNLIKWAVYWTKAPTLYDRYNPGQDPNRFGDLNTAFQHLENFVSKNFAGIGWEGYVHEIK